MEDISQPSLCSPDSITIWRRSIVLFGAIALISLPAATPVSVSSQSAPERDHHLFVGINLSYAEGTKMLKVDKLQGNSAVLDTPNRERRELARDPGLQWKRSTKVSSNFVNIDGLSLREAYIRPRQEVRERLTEQMEMQNYAAYAVDMAEARMREGSVLLTRDVISGGDSVSGTTAASSGEGEDLSILDEALSMQDSLSDAGLMGGVGESADRQAVNAIEINFEISTPQPIADAHVFGTAIVRSKDGFTDIVFHQAVGEIGQSPKRITIEQHGLPPDFEIKQSTIHVFSQGEEFATTHSEKHYELTSGEAKEFATLEHTSDHRRKDSPAKPSWSLAPIDLHATTSPDTFDYLVTVKISDSGKLESIESKNQILPDHVEAIVRQIVFLPAVENGQPVASTLTFNPVDFFKN